MNLQSDCSLTEGKSFGGRRTFASEKSILMSTLVRLIGSLKANLDRKMIARAVSNYCNLKEEFRDALFGILDSYQKGEIAADVLESMWRFEIKDAWQKAYELGVRSVGNPFGVWEQDKSWLKGAEAEEYGYLGRFVEDIEKNALEMGIADRLGMYIETLDGVYHHGQVDGSPEFVKIHWILRESRHCLDCIKFAAGSPYTKKNLPCVPRDGTSHCLSNCHCRLRFEYAESKPEPENYIIKGPKPIVPPTGYRLPTDKERDKLGQMYAEIERIRGLIPALSGDAKKEMIGARRDLNKVMIDFMEKHRVYWVPGGQTQKIRFVETITDEVKKELLIEGGPGSGFFGHKGRPGKRGGSLPGKTMPHGETRVSSTFMARYLNAWTKQGRYKDPTWAMNLIRSKFPRQPEARYARALLKANLVVRPSIARAEAAKGKGTSVGDWAVKKGIKIDGPGGTKERLYKVLSAVPQKHLMLSGTKSITVMPVEKVNEAYRLRTGDADKNLRVDAFYDHDVKEMVLSPSAPAATILHEFAHSLIGVGAYKKQVWDANASQGSVGRYGATSMQEGFSEAYAKYALHGNYLRERASKIADVMEKVFSL